MIIGGGMERRIFINKWSKVLPGERRKSGKHYMGWV